MPRGDQISRQWRILRELETRRMGVTVPDLAAELGSNVRSVYRDMKDLELAGFPIYNEKDDGVERWKFVEGYKHKIPIPLEMTEIMALVIARDQMKAFDGTVFSDALHRALDKMKATLKPEAHAFMEGLAGSFRVGIGGRRDYHKHADTVELVNKAVVEHRTIVIKYGTNATERKIDPYHVWFMAGTIYIVAHCHKRQNLRLFVIDRIKKAKLTDERFVIPADFSMDAFTGNRFRVTGGDDLTTVRIKFFPDLAGYIKEWIWHPSQVIADEKDGSIILTMNVEGLFEVKNWVLSFGDRAKVLEPKRLANDVYREAQSIAKLYK